MISIFNAALDAAMTIVPKLLIADWITILATANTAPWIPAGIPIRKIRPATPASNLNSVRLWVKQAWESNPEASTLQIMLRAAKAPRVLSVSILLLS